MLDRSTSNPSVIEVNEWDTTSRNFGIALDIGTTTVVLSLVDLSNGNVVTQASAYNKQIMCGEDILARIAFAEDGGLDRLHRLVIDTINSLLTQVSNNSDKCKATNQQGVQGGDHRHGGRRQHHDGPSFPGPAPEDHTV